MFGLLKPLQSGSCPIVMDKQLALLRVQWTEYNDLMDWDVYLKSLSINKDYIILYCKTYKP